MQKTGAGQGDWKYGGELEIWSRRRWGRHGRWGRYSWEGDLGIKSWRNWGHSPSRYLGVSVSWQREEQWCGPSGRWWLACWKNAKEVTVPRMWTAGNEAREEIWAEHRVGSWGPLWRHWLSGSVSWKVIRGFWGEQRHDPTGVILESLLLLCAKERIN